MLAQEQNEMVVSYLQSCGKTYNVLSFYFCKCFTNLTLKKL
jgi:hypothetical protein